MTGSVDGVIKRWDLSGEGKKKETEIVKKGGEKMDKFEEILKEPTSEKMKKPQEKIAKIPKRRFLDFYFEDAILAEENRIKLSQNGKARNFNYCLFSFIFYVEVLTFKF
jgi:hypothetical protein